MLNRRPKTSGQLAALLFSLLLTASSGCGGREDILLLAREGDATSLAIATTYAEHLGLGSRSVLALPLSAETDAVVLSERAFLDEIAAPVEAHLADVDPDGLILRLVTTQGLPLLVETAAGERASLDLAVAQIGRTPEGRAFSSAANPYFRAARDFEAFRRAEPDAALRFLVTRWTMTDPAIGSGTDHLSGFLDLLESSADEPRDVPAPTWQVPIGEPGARPHPALALLIDPVSKRLPLFAHHVCDRCPQAEGVNGIVLAAARDAVLPELSGPGLVFSLGATPPARRSERGDAFAPFAARALQHGGRAITLHLDDERLAHVARPEAALDAWALGHTAAEAHFQSLPRLDGSQVFVGDGLRALAEARLPESLERDRDGDGIPNHADNCVADPNPDQRDTNGDGIGNLCDPDLDGDGLVASSSGRIYPVEDRGDLETLQLTLERGSYDPDHDLDGNGRVDRTDLLRVELGLGRAPGR